METRLNLLCDAGVIDKDICKGMMQVVNVLETECHLPVRSEQGNDGDDTYGERTDAQSPW
ncbi:PRD domain protein,/AHA_3910 family [Escherichia coli]|uniref:PRD domain protein,/AHA_3910 family n=1 Tax=Escherichia coli TaxID=562 RepID=A0A376MKT9_ECOLX|nr:PRD domain protein,/AHA_3910 family [Escherichia coli]